MLQRVVSSWGKLFGFGDSSLAVEEDRRHWGRIPCDVETTCTPVGPAAVERSPARVRNVSRGGISLEVSRSFQPGELLSVALPGGHDAENTCELLACVIRCWAEEGGHQIACTFATQLSDDELVRFGQRNLRPAAPEQRASLRFPCLAQAAFSVVGAPEEEAPSPAIVVNASASGIALEVSAPRTVGELVSIDLWRGKDRPVVTTLASVVRSTVERDGRRIAGCSFINELSEEQVRRLL